MRSSPRRKSRVVLSLKITSEVQSLIVTIQRERSAQNLGYMKSSVALSDMAAQDLSCATCSQLHYPATLSRSNAAFVNPALIIAETDPAH